jgi:cyclophilin family peptidyl-prolyl cis-trans isomerase
MRLTIPRILAIVFIVIAFGFYLNSRRNRLLPTGKISQTEAVSLGTSDISQAVITGRPQVEIATSRGKFVVELRPDLAQNTVINYMQKWASGYCNSLTFHRVEDWVIQGCDPKGNGTGGTDDLSTETSSQAFTAGSLGVARRPASEDKSNSSQFFIVKKDSSFLNGEYTYFGQVISGMEIVNSIMPGDRIISTEILTK